MKKIFLMTVSVLCFALPATAQETVSSAKQNSYLTFRLGAGRMNMEVKTRKDNDKENKTLLAISGAVGTTIADGVRAEVELMAFEKYEDKVIDGSGQYYYEQSVANISVNILKDFDAGKIKPYIGGGLGFAVFHDESEYNFMSGMIHYRGKWKDDNVTLSANIQAGLAMDVTDKVGIDVNARYTYFDSYECFNDAIKMKNQTLNFTAGLRFNF